MIWYGDEFIQKIEAQTNANLDRVGVYGQGTIRQSISTPSRTVTAGQTRAGKAKKILGARGSNRSKPGEPPHKDFGTLRSSIAWLTDREGHVVRIGTALAYGKFLELGTSKMGARPYLRPFLANNRPEIVKLVTAGLPANPTP